MVILWFLGFYGLILANRGLKGRVRERDRAETKLQKAHDKLEMEAIVPINRWIKKNYVILAS